MDTVAVKIAFLGSSWASNDQTRLYIFCKRSSLFIVSTSLNIFSFPVFVWHNGRNYNSSIVSIMGERETEPVCVSNVCTSLVTSLLNRQLHLLVQWVFFRIQITNYYKLKMISFLWILQGDIISLIISASQRHMDASPNFSSWPFFFFIFIFLRIPS